MQADAGSDEENAEMMVARVAPETAGPSRRQRESSSLTPAKYISSIRRQRKRFFDISELSVRLALCKRSGHQNEPRDDVSREPRSLGVSSEFLTGDYRMSPEPGAARGSIGRTLRNGGGT